MSSLSDFLSAIRAQESGGDYRAVNQHTGALGLYQVLPSNVGPWSRKYLGYSVTSRQFLNNATLQNRLVGAVMRDYVRRYGYRGAASAWYSGNPALANNYNPQRYGPSIGAYVDQVMKRMDQGGFSTSAIAGGFGAFADAARNAIGAAAQQTLESTPELAKDRIVDSIVTGDAEEIGQPEATQALGLDIEDGAGSGQLGIEAGMGIDSPSGPPGSTDFERALEEGVSRSNPRDSLTVTGAGIGGSGLINPLQGFKVTFGFGEAYAHAGHAAGSHHRGLDFAAPGGTRIRLPEGARIVSAGWENSGFGYAIRYQAADGTYGILGHLSAIASNIRAGMTLRAGTYIGRVGTTGDSSGNHLHWEKRRRLSDPSSAYNFYNQIEW